jgi:hypothetical protein
MEEMRSDRRRTTMRVEIEIDERLKDRNDLIQIMNAAADYLKSRDTDADSQALARWRLWEGPNGEAFIGLGLQDHDYSIGKQFTPNQLVPADIRELRLISLWNDVLSKRSWREFNRVNDLIRQFQEG